LIRAALADAAADPATARRLLAAPTPRTMREVFQPGGRLSGLVRRLLPAGTSAEERTQQPYVHRPYIP
jgi:hypothetical protein